MFEGTSKSYTCLDFVTALMPDDDHVPIVIGVLGTISRNFIHYYTQLHISEITQSELQKQNTTTNNSGGGDEDNGDAIHIFEHRSLKKIKIIWKVHNSHKNGGGGRLKNVAEVFTNVSRINFILATTNKQK